MQTLLTALLGAALGAWALAPAPAAESEAGPETSAEAELEACKQRCVSIEDESDRATCRLNCREATEGKERGHIIRWTEERSVGGPAPGQDTAPPPVRTVTTVTPRGETTVTHGPKPAPEADAPATVRRPPPTPRQRYYFGLVECQERCDPIADGEPRARCKLLCLRRSPGPPPPRG